MPPTWNPNDPKEDDMPLKKKYLKSKPLAKVTFTVPKEGTAGAKKAHLVGEFNNWDTTATPMRRLKDGTFTATLDLETGRSYEYRYLLDNDRWENDWEADRYQKSPMGIHENSVVDV
jgi:1,4-alpha-glucan branching enzyme